MKWTPERDRRLWEARIAGVSISDCAGRFGVGTASITQRLTLLRKTSTTLKPGVRVPRGESADERV
jgi:hypothetical protein